MQIKASAIATRQRYTIVGGGLAGLSTLYHLLEELDSSSCNGIRLWDTHGVGQGGASAVAGGLLHPLSPSGKLVYRGSEGMKATAKLLDAASQHEDSVVLRHKMYRIAHSVDQATTLKKTAVGAARDLCPWVPDYANHGALKLHSGCCVIHVPSYLSGLWKSCERVAAEKEIDLVLDTVNPLVKDLDFSGVVVWSAGSGMFMSGNRLRVGATDLDLPVQLVRGQSLELTLASRRDPVDAVLGGKYISPMPRLDRVMVGATHEFSPERWSRKDVVSDLRERTESFAPHGLWEEFDVHRVTCGTRVQTERSHHGRLPIVGRIGKNAWIFSGLSSRGLLYHGLYGRVLVEAMLNQTEELDVSMQWWQSSKTHVAK